MQRGRLVAADDLAGRRNGPVVGEEGLDAVILGRARTGRRLQTAETAVRVRVAGELTQAEALAEDIRQQSDQVAAAERGPQADAVAALTGLGFASSEALTAVAASSSALGDNAGVEALIRDSLGRLAPRGDGP